MVAELTSIASAVANNNSHKQVTHAPRWIQAATKPSVHRYQCSSDQPMYTTVSKPKDASESTGRGNGGDVAGTTATDPVGLLSRRGIVGLVGPYRASSDGLDAMGTRDQRASTRGSEGRIFVLRDEELVEEGDYNEPSRVCLAENSRKRLHEDGSVSDASPTPGRENWKLREGKNLTGDARGEAGERGGVSLTDVWHKDWDVHNDQPERDSLNDANPVSEQATTTTPVELNKQRRHQSRPKLRGGRSLLDILTSGRTSALDMLDHTESFCQLWVLLSSLYGKLVVIVMLTFCVTEVMDNSIKLLSLQGIFLMYLYVGSIAVIICIYIWVLIDSCSSLNSQNEMATTHRVTSPANAATAGDPDAELGGGLTLARFGSLKRAHISRAKTSGTSFYLRVGALAFGLGTLVFNGLEMAMHSMMEGACLNDVVFIHPVLHGLFTFLQMHFLFVNSQVLVERFGLAARFGFMHLAATNLALWVRLIVWESGNEWTYFVHLSQSSGVRGGVSNNIPTPLQLRGFPRSVVARHQRDLSFSSNATSYYSYRPISDSHISQVVALHECLNTNTLGQLWTSSMPFLYPFIVQFSLIAAAVTFVMGQNVGRGRIFMKQKKLANSHSKGCSMPSAGEHSLRSTWSVDCGGASKGLFLGILCLVAGIVVIIIFLVVKEDEEFPTDTIFWLTTGAVAAMLGLCCVMTSVGLVQIRRLSTSGQEPTPLDTLLSDVSTAGVQLYAVFGIVVGASGLGIRDITDSGIPHRHAMLLAVSALQLVQVTGQSVLIAEALRRATLTRHQMLAKPARQVITFLLCSNAVLWAYDTFVTQSWLSQELQLRFFGVLAWGIISRIGLPLLIFYRFHSCVLLLEIWKRSYRTPILDPGN